MSNRKRLGKNPPKNIQPQSENEVVLTEENKNEVAALLGYSIETVDKMLSKASSLGYKGVRLSTLKK